MDGPKDALGSINNPGSYPPQGNAFQGLDYLLSLSTVLVQEEVQNMQVGCTEMQKAYQIKNKESQLLYRAIEDCTNCTKFCHGPRHPFTMKIMDTNGKEVVYIHRPLRITCTGQSERLEVFSPPGTLAGIVQQKFRWCNPVFKILNSDGSTALRIEGPCTTLSCCSDVHFRIMSADGCFQVGRITKRWVGWKQCCARINHFKVDLPVDLDLKMKAVLMSSCFLINDMYFTTYWQALLVFIPLLLFAFIIFVILI